MTIGGRRFTNYNDKINKQCFMKKSEMISGCLLLTNKQIDNITASIGAL